MAKKPARTVASLSKKEMKTARLGKPKFFRSAEFDKKPTAAAFKKAKAKLAALPVPKPHAVKVLAKKDEAAAWTDADEELKKEAAKKKGKAAHPPSAVPVESDKPGVARNPKPPKVVKPLAADGALVPPEIISYHFLKLMERMAAEHGGTSAQALEDLKADIAKRKPT